jgi:2-polyprenyl-3-methyl-5-hydroxy-6-metoxy-1,4-benzoquinol methylase
MSPDKTPDELRIRIKHHFDAISGEYDTYKKHSYYYYSQLQLLLKELIPEHASKNILEVGCATGTLLAALYPAKGLGVDISDNMIKIARKKWEHRPELQFQVSDAENLEVDTDWDAVILSDVLEHLYDPVAAISRFSQIFSPGTIVVFTWANTIWEPVLHLLERMNLKMPEGDHNWESRTSVLKLLQDRGFKVLNVGTRCLIPAKLPLSDRINRRFHRIPILKNAGLICFIKAALKNPEQIPANTCD